MHCSFLRKCTHTIRREVLILTQYIIRREVLILTQYIIRREVLILTQERGYYTNSGCKYAQTSG